MKYMPRHRRVLWEYRIRMPNSALGKGEMRIVSWSGHLWKAGMESIPILLDILELGLKR